MFKTISKKNRLVYKKKALTDFVKKIMFPKQVLPKDHILKHLNAPPPPQRIQISIIRYSIIPYNEYTNNLHHYILPVYNIIIFIRDVEIIKFLRCPVYKALYNT